MQFCNEPIINKASDLTSNKTYISDILMSYCYESIINKVIASDPTYSGTKCNGIQK